MQNTDQRTAVARYMERLGRRFSPPKKWTWRRKFAHILEIDEMRREYAVQTCENLAILDLDALAGARRLTSRLRFLLFANEMGYHDFVSLVENDLARARDSESLAFVAHYEHLLFRLRHLDTPL